ncbi:SGNH/GDSL hydrolase family protein, partial [Planctomycetota bacterium]
EDCERFVSYTRSRVGWRRGNLQSERTFMKSKAAMKSRLSMGQGKGPGLRAAVQGEGARNKALFYIEGKAVFTFWYFITSSRDNVKGDRLHINLRNRSQMDDFFVDVRNPVRGKWSFCAVPIIKFHGRALFGANFKEGDKISGFTIGYGSPGDEVTLYVDNICAVTGSTLYYMKAKIIDDITVDYRKEFYSMDIYIMEKMISRAAAAKTRTNRSLILAVGDQHMNSAFVGLLKGASGKKIITNKGAGTDRVMTADVLSSVEELLPKVKPGITVICTGLNDVVSGMGDASLYATTLQMIVDLCYEHGSLPVLISIPAVKDDEVAQGIYELNKIVQQVAEEQDLPFIDAYKLFSFMADNNKYYSNKLLLSKAGYQTISKKFGKIAKAINKWVFR